MPSFQPRYTLTPALVRSLVAIEVASEAIGRAALTPVEREALRQQARLRSTHFSTRIEGNRLTLAEATRVIAERGVRLPGRERDIGEVRQYWHALRRVEEWAASRLPVTEERSSWLHERCRSRSRSRGGKRRTAAKSVADLPSRSLGGWWVAALPELHRKPTSGMIFLPPPLPPPGSWSARKPPNYSEPTGHRTASNAWV